MNIIRIPIAVGMILLFSCIAYASDADHDSRRLTAAEQKTFFPLVCNKPILHDKENSCAALNSYPGDTPTFDKSSLSLDAIAYGSFTSVAADQAYVTYSADFEPHVNNFGGGILFERTTGRWKLIRWYPGGQMDRCLALPLAGTLNMLCLSGYTGQGEVDSSVWLQHIPQSNERNVQLKAMAAILKAQDDRESGNSNYQCAMKRAKNEAILLSIDNLKRSKTPGFFAESSVTYVTVRDEKVACIKGEFADVKETRAVVRYELHGGKIFPVTPIKFAPTDY